MHRADSLLAGGMFTLQERDGIRARLIDQAGADARVVGAAIVGSAARGTEDEWSDIDLVLQLGEAADEAAVVADWTADIDQAHGVADTIDVVTAQGWTSRQLCQ